MKETRLELAFSRYEVYEEKIREVYRPKWLLSFAVVAGEYVRILWPLFLHLFILCIETLPLYGGRRDSDRQEVFCKHHLTISPWG